MKTTLTIFILTLAVALRSQCGFTMPSSSTVCINTALTLTATGATNYTWSLPGTGVYIVMNTTDTTKFTHTYGWNKIVTVKGVLNGCLQTQTLTVTVVNCSVGIKEYELNGMEPSYYDMFGKPVEKAYNTVLIEMRGPYRRKVIFTNSH